MHKLAIALVCLFVGGCANTQLNKNTGDLATSLSSIEKRQIVSNLARALNEDEYIPSQVILTLGSATTSNSISPTLGLPFGYGFTSTTALTTGTSAGSSIGGGTSVAAPTLTLALTDSWNQNWTMTPPSDPGQLGRLRELYLYVAGYTKQLKMTDTEVDSKEATAQKAKADKRFLCNYPVQALAVNFAAPIPTSVPATGSAASAVNVAYKVDCDDSPNSRTVYADPTFLLGPDCVICLDIDSANIDRKWGAISLSPKIPGQSIISVNPRLPYRLAFTQMDRAGKRKLIGSDENRGVYIDGGDLIKFGDLAMFTHQALSQSASATSGGGANGKTQNPSALAVIYSLPNLR